MLRNMDQNRKWIRKCRVEQKKEAKMIEKPHII